jgi:hypothetical protein
MQLGTAPVSILSSPGAGRYAVAKRDIAAGEVVLVGRPYAVAISTSQICALCLREKSKNESRCGICGAVYCSTACLGFHSEFHQRSGQCRVQQLMHVTKLATKLDDSDRETLQLIAGILARASMTDELKGPLVTDSDALPPVFTATGDLNALVHFAQSSTLPANASMAEGVDAAQLSPTVAHVLQQVPNVEQFGAHDFRRVSRLFTFYDRTLRSADSRTPFSITSTTQEDPTVEEAESGAPSEVTPQRHLPKVSERLFERLCGIDQCNSFGFWRTKSKRTALRCHAVATIPSAAFFNHSCAPNIARVNIGTCVAFLAVEDVPEGAALCISYVDVTMDAKDRRRELEQNYKFVCGCERCMRSLDHNSKLCAHCSNGVLVPSDWPAIQALHSSLGTSGPRQANSCTCCGSGE